MYKKGIILTSILITILLFSILPSYGFMGLTNKTDKIFDKYDKSVTIKNINKNTDLTIKQLSVKEGVCEFEEIFEITSTKDYTPSKDKDFKLKFNHNTYKEKFEEPKGEWFVLKNEEWKKLTYGKIIKGSTNIYKLVVSKKAELGSNEIQVVPSFGGVECEELTWWNVSWRRRINSTLSNVPAGGYTYNLSVHSGIGTNTDSDVYLNGLGATNFKDIRFTLDDTQELDYWIEDNSTDPIRVYVDVPSNGVVYMYYNNSDVETTSDIRGIGVFGDDFRDGTKWTSTKPADYKIEDGLLKINGTYSATDKKIYTTSTFSSVTNYSIQARVKMLGGYGGVPVYSCIQNGYTIPQTGAVNYTGMKFRFGTTGICNGYYQSEASSVLHVSPWSPQKGIKIYQHENHLLAEGYDNTFTSLINITYFWRSGGIPSMNRFMVSQYDDYGLDMEFDDLLIRKYTSPEPQWSTWSESETEQVYEGISITQYNSQRKLARTSEGYLHRVYTLYDGLNYRVYYSRSIDDGSSWIETILTSSGEDCKNPAIAVDSNDNIWVVYEGYTDAVIKYRRYTGISWEDEVELEASPYGLVPSIAIDSNDNIHLSWYIDYWIIHVLAYKTYNGTEWENTEWLVTSNYPQYPSVSVDTNDYIHIAWQEYNSTSESWNIKHIKYTDSWQSIYNVTNGETYNQTHPCIVSDMNGNTHIIWETEDYKIQAVKYTGTWEAIKTVYDGGIYEQRNPSISVYSDNYVNAVWYGKSASRPDNYAIRRSYRTGSSWSSVSDILYPSEKDVVFPTLISALYPETCAECYNNIPEEGYAFIYDENTEIEYYDSDDLEWRCPTKYTLKINAINIRTGEQITDFSADIGTGETLVTETGSVTFRCLDTGYYNLKIVSTGYYTYIENIVLDTTKEITVAMTPITEEDYYLPQTKNVKFTVQNLWGNVRFDNVTVTAVGYNITHPYGWLGTYFGFENTTEIYNTTMTGTTDDEGEIVFVMVETIKYRVTFVKEDEGINKTWFKYPKDDEYVIVIWSWEYPDEGTEELLDTTINVTTSTINDSHAYIYVNYNDPSNLTTSLNINVTRLTTFNNEEIVYDYTLTNQSSVNESLIVTPYTGRSFDVKVTSTHERWGVKTWEYGIKFKGLLSDLELPTLMYPIIAIAIIFFIGGLFGATTALQGSLMICAVSWVFYGIGWLNINSDAVMVSALSLATVISVLSLILEKGRRLNVQ